jgi:hypothetical protein
MHSSISIFFNIRTSRHAFVAVFWGSYVRVPSPTGDSTQVVGMRERGQGSVVAAAARGSRGGERTAAAAWNSQLLEEAGNKSLISLPLFRRGDYIFIVLGLYQ